MLTQTEKEKQAKVRALQRKLENHEEEVERFKQLIKEEYAKVKDFNTSHEVTQWAIDRIEGLKGKIKSGEGQIKKIKRKLGQI